MFSRCSWCKDRIVWPWGEVLVQVDDFKPWHKKCYNKYYWDYFYSKYEEVEKGRWRLKE